MSNTIATEQAADLAALQAAATSTEAGAPGAIAQQEQPVQPSAAALQMAAMAVGILKPIIAYAVPALRNAPDELWAPIPEGVAAVMDHYGASADWMQSPWARLAISLAPLAAFGAMEAMKEKPEKPKSLGLEAAAPEAPEQQRTVTFGAPAANAEAVATA